MAQLFDPKGVGDYTRRALQRLKEYVDTRDAAVTAGYVAADAAVKTLVGFVEATSSTWSPTPTQTTETDITGSPSNLTLTLSLSTARRYKAVCNLRLETTHQHDTAYIRFIEGGVDRKLAYTYLGFTGNGQTVHGEWVFVPASSASTVYKVRGARNLGNGTITMPVTTTSPAQFWIEDLGPI